MARTIVAIVLCGLLLAGCVNGPTSPAVEYPDHPSDLTVPEWKVGNAWQFLGDDGVWHNWTVVSKEVKNNIETYKVEIKQSAPDSYGSHGMTRWIDVKTLGNVESIESTGVWSRSRPASVPIFPVENQSYGVEYTTSYGTQHHEVTKTIGPWTQVDMPSGSWKAVQVKHTSESMGYVLADGWYNPEVKFYVQYDHYEPKQLVSWNVA